MPAAREVRATRYMRAYYCVSCSTERKARNAYRWAAPWCRLWHSSGAWNACSAWHPWSAWHAHVRWSHALPATDADTFGWVNCVQCVHCVTCVSCITCPGSVRVQQLRTDFGGGAWLACGARHVCQPVFALVHPVSGSSLLSAWCVAPISGNFIVKDLPFIVTGGTGGCCYYGIRWYRQSWQF